MNEYREAGKKLAPKEPNPGEPWWLFVVIVFACWAMLALCSAVAGV